MVDGHHVASLDLDTAKHERLFGHHGGHAALDVVLEHTGPGFVLQRFGFRAWLVASTLPSAALAATTGSATLASSTLALAATASLTAAPLLRRVGLGLGLGHLLTAHRWRAHLVLGQVRGVLLTRTGWGLDLTPSPLV